MSGSEQIGRMQRSFPEITAFGTGHRHTEVDGFLGCIEETLLSGLLTDLQQFDGRENRNIERRSSIQSHRFYERGSYLEIILAVVTAIGFESK